MNFIKQRIIKGKPPAIISAAKAVTWRLVGTLDTLIVSYLVTGKPGIAISISTVEMFSKTLLYFLHERGWEFITIKEFTILPLTRGSRYEKNRKLKTDMS